MVLIWRNVKKLIRTVTVFWSLVMTNAFDPSPTTTKAELKAIKRNVTLTLSLIYFILFNIVLAHTKKKRQDSSVDLKETRNKALWRNLI